MWDTMGRAILLMGVFLAVLGGLMMAGGKLFGLGRLPGDIFVQRGNFGFYFPLATCIVLSILLTLILNIFIRR